MSAIVEFLTDLWTSTPAGRILLWEKATKRSAYLSSPTGATGIAAGTPDLYVGCGLAHVDHGAHRRTTNDKVIAIAGLWADIDIDGGPEDKQGAAPDRDAALDAANALTQPTILIDSGYGLQAWWLFDEPWRFATYGDQRLAARAVAQWQVLLRDAAGFGIDYTHDLARILRVPGTSNAKGEQHVPVAVIERGPRHERDELIEIAAAAGDIDPGYRIGEPSSQPNVACRPGIALPKLPALMTSSPKFRRTWRHDRVDLPSASEIDLSLAAIAALAGWSDQEIADLISVHRRINDPSDPKAERVDYVRRTIQRVRDGEPETVASATTSSATRSGSLRGEGWGELVLNALEASDDGAIPMPFERLTRIMDGGLRPGEVCIVAGWTSHGKSVFVDQMADAAADAGRRVHLYLTEMTARERGLRLLARRAGVPFVKLRRREGLDEHWPSILHELGSMPYGVSVVADWTVEDVVADIVEQRWDLVVVDLIHGFHYQDERDLSKTSSALVRAAKASAGPDFAGTTIVCVAHLNDGQMRDSRSPKRPQPGLHSIKGSSALKQDADVVMFVYREDDDEGVPTEDGQIWIAKARQGGLGGIAVTLDVRRMCFVEQLRIVA